MTPSELLAAFETLAEAPEGVARLRELVLSLAVRGKLVAQDPGEEPASELLRKAVDGASDDGSRSTRQRRNLEQTSSTADEAFLLPNGWTWTTTSHLGVTSPRNRALDEDEASFVPMPMIPTKWGGALRFEVKGWGTVKRGYTHIADGDIVFAKITPCFQNGKACVVKGLRNGIGAGTTELHVLRPDPGVVVPEYMLIFYRSPQFVLGGMATLSGTAGQQRVSTAYFCETPVPLPPLAEQHRIVARVDELMGLLDRLEAVRNRRDEVRRAARDAALAALRDAPDAEAVEAAWTRISGEIHALFARPEDVAPLRQAVLQLAVQGRLVPQDSPSILIASGCGATNSSDSHSKPKDVRRGEAPKPTVAQIGFSVPNGWRCEPMERICTHIVDCLHRTPKYSDSGFPAIRTSDMRLGHIVWQGAKRVPEDEYAEQTRRLAPIAGDILYAREGSWGDAGVVPHNVTLCISQRMTHFRVRSGVSPFFVSWVLNSPHTRQRLGTAVTGMTVPHVNLSDLRKLLIALPPLSEQHSIVAKVDALMALCDAIEARLTSARSLHSQAAAAAVHHLDV